MTIEEPPQGADPDADVACCKAGLELGERDVALLLQHRHDLLSMDVRLRRTLVTARLLRHHTPMLARKLVPADRTRHTHAEPPRSTAAAQAAVNRRNDPITQILR